MKYKYVFAIYCCLALTVSQAQSQGNLSRIPTFAVGQPAEVRAFEGPRNCDATSGNLGSCRPNLIAGFELNNPQGVAIDQSSGAVYVADTLNNRVLGWRSIASLSSGARADVVIGQVDLLSANAGGPGSAQQALRQSGLRRPTAVAVDASGNLFVADAGNNRILRYRQPFSQPEGLKLASQVIGQPSLGTNGANAGGLSAASLDTTDSGVVFRTALAFDAQGNLWLPTPTIIACCAIRPPRSPTAHPTAPPPTWFSDSPISSRMPGSAAIRTIDWSATECLNRVRSH